MTSRDYSDPKEQRMGTGMGRRTLRNRNDKIENNIIQD